MVSVHITDASSVTASGETITGPCTFDSASFVHGSGTITQGVVVVQAGTSKLVSDLHPQTAAALPYGMIVCFILGLIWSRQAFLH